MTLREIIALMRRHAVAVGMIILIASCLAFHFATTKPMYLDSATLAFTAGSFRADRGEVVMSQVMTSAMMSKDTQSQVWKDGGTAAYDVALVNLNNENYPDYGDPYVTVTTSSRDPVQTQHTFSVVMQVLTDELAMRQTQAGADSNFRITANMMTDSGGPIIQPGYRTRTFAGLAVLTVVAAFLASTFLDRYPVRLRGL